MSKRYTLRIILPAIVVLGLISIYAFIPGTLFISGKVHAHALDQSLYTTLKRLRQPERNVQNRLPSSIQNASFKIAEITYPYFDLHSAQQEGKGSLEIIPTSKVDSTIIEWKWKLSAGINPITRVKAYFQLQRLKDSLSNFTQNIASYTSQTLNSYGLNIKSANITDTLIATVAHDFTSTPTPEMICQLIEKLHEELQLATLENSGITMLSQRVEGDKYRVMVGTSVRERTSSASALKMKKINPSKLLFGEVYGGPKAVQSGYTNLRTYIMDRNIEEAGIPYEIPLTNRCAEKDTSKWLTRICYPVY